MTASLHWSPDTGATARELLLFRIGAEFFAVDLAAVEEAIEVPDVHRLPDMPSAMLGVFTLRGRMLPVYSPAQCLDVSATTEAAVVLVMRRHGDQRVGLAVDDIEDVILLDPSMMHRPPMPDPDDTVLLGVARHGAEPVGVVDAASLIAACTAAPSSDTP